MIIIMPDANTGTRGYSNNATGTWLYEDFFFQELMPFVEKKYRIKAEKRYRAVSGLINGRRWNIYVCLASPGVIFFRLSAECRYRSTYPGRCEKQCE